MAHPESSFRVGRLSAQFPKRRQAGESRLAGDYRVEEASSPPPVTMLPVYETGYPRIAACLERQDFIDSN